MARVASAPSFFFAQKFQAGTLIQLLEICGIAYRMIPFLNWLANPNHRPLMNVDILSSGGASSFAHAHGRRCDSCGLAGLTMKDEYGPDVFSSIGFFAQTFQAGTLILFLEICGLAYRMIPFLNRLANPNHKPLK